MPEELICTPKCSKGSVGKLYSYASGRIGNLQLKWAFSETMRLFTWESDRAKAYVTKHEKKHGKGKAMWTQYLNTSTTSEISIMSPEFFRIFSTVVLEFYSEHPNFRRLLQPGKQLYPVCDDRRILLPGNKDADISLRNIRATNPGFASPFLLEQYGCVLLFFGFCHLIY